MVSQWISVDLLLFPAQRGLVVQDCSPSFSIWHPHFFTQVEAPFQLSSVKQLVMQINLNFKFELRLKLNFGNCSVLASRSLVSLNWIFVFPNVRYLFPSLVKVKSIKVVLFQCNIIFQLIRNSTFNSLHEIFLCERICDIKLHQNSLCKDVLNQFASKLNPNLVWCFLFLFHSWFPQPLWCCLTQTRDKEMSSPLPFAHFTLSGHWATLKVYMQHPLNLEPSYIWVSSIEDLTCKCSNQ